MALDLDAIPSPPELADLDRELLGDLAQTDPYGVAQYLVENCPRISAKQLAAELHRLGGPRLSKGQAKAWKEAVVKGQTQAPDASKIDFDQVDPTTAEDRLRAAERMGDARDAARWAQVAVKKQEIGISLEEDDEGPDLSLLTEVQFSAYCALVKLAQGVVTDDETLWWRALFARVPTQRHEVHPAHIALPPGSPEPEALTGTTARS